MGDSMPKISKNDLEELREAAYEKSLDKSRICTHVSIEDSLHEMFIYHSANAYVRPHKHHGKGESFFLLEGEVDAVFFDDSGVIVDVIEMGGDNNTMYYRLRASLYHTILIKSDYIFFYEATGGPFRREDTSFAPWSPDENEIVKVEQYRLSLIKQTRAYLQTKESEVER